MKKIIYLFAVIGLMIASGCDPMHDINKELDAIVDPIVGDEAYTLTDEDYDDLELSYGSFSNLDDAKAMLPPFLAEKYPVWGKGSSVLVGYKLYVGSAPGVGDYTYADVYNLTMDDYALSGSNVLGYYPDVNPKDYIADALAASISSPSDDDIKLVKFIQYTEVPVVISSKIHLEENFDFGSTAGDITTVTTDWTNHSGSAPVGYVTENLSMTGYPTSGVGGAVTISGSGSEDVNRTFTPVTSGKVYGSALVNLSAVGDGTYFFHFMNEEFGYTARVGAKDNGSGKILFGIGASSSTLTYGTTAYDLNTTYLLVSSYDIGSGKSDLYVLTSAVASEPGTPEATNEGNSGLNVQKVGIRQGGGGPTGTIDGIRVASSWTSIMSNEIIEDVVTGDKVYDKAFYTFSGGEWEEATDGVYLLTVEDFDSMGEEYNQPGYYNNFGSTLSPDDYVPTFLNLKYPYALEEEELLVIYDYYSSSSGAQLRGNLYTVTDGSWKGFESTINTTLQFSHDGTSWVPDNTIKYTFGAADYDYIVESLGSKYPSETANMASYGNFNGYSWDTDMILEAINNVLLKNNPSAAEGQKYAVTYSIYDGSTHDATVYVILEGGAYVYQ